MTKKHTITKNTLVLISSCIVLTMSSFIGAMDEASPRQSKKRRLFEAHNATPPTQQYVPPIPPPATVIFAPPAPQPAQPAAQSADQRSPAKVDVFTRNPAKLIVSPQLRRLGEARRFSGRLGRMYRQQRPKTAGPSPYKSRNRNTKRRERALPLAEAAAIHDAAVLLEQWDARVTTPEGYTVYQNDAIIDPFQEDAHGRINIQRMLHGEPPLGPGGAPLELHHALRQDPGPLLEVTEDLHRRESGPAHGIEQTQHIDRPAFDRFRRAYWTARAYDMLESDPRFIN